MSTNLVQLNAPQPVQPVRPTRESVKNELDLLGIWRTLWRRRLFLLGFIFCVIGATAAGLSRVPPGFEAEARLE